MLVILEINTKASNHLHFLLCPVSLTVYLRISNDAGVSRYMQLVPDVHLHVQNNPHYTKMYAENKFKWSCMECMSLNKEQRLASTNEVSLME